MNNLIKIGLFAVIVFALLTFFEIKDVESQARPTATKTRTRTATATQTVTVTNTVTPSRTVTPSPTITFSPTVTLTPSATPVQKTQILLFENQRLWPGQALTSNIIDVKEFSEVTVFLSSSLVVDGYSGNEAICYFLPEGGIETDRYIGETVAAITKSVGGRIDQQAVANGRIIGPKMICEVANKSQWATVKSVYIYLIP